jgi:hypothetical protein
MSIFLTELAQDNFATDPNASPLPNPPWTPLTGIYASDTLQVESGLCEPTNTLGVEIYNGITLPDDQYCSATVETLTANSDGTAALCVSNQ